MAKKKFIDAQNFTLDEWLNVIFSDKCNLVFPSNCFPNDKAREEYLERVKNLSDTEVKKSFTSLASKDSQNRS